MLTLTLRTHHLQKLWNSNANLCPSNTPERKATNKRGKWLPTAIYNAPSFLLKQRNSWVPLRPPHWTKFKYTISEKWAPKIYSHNIIELSSCYWYIYAWCKSMTLKLTIVSELSTDKCFQSACRDEEPQTPVLSTPCADWKCCNALFVSGP